MPGVISHFLLAEECARQSTSPLIQRVAAQFPEAFFWGSVGPDYLYFHPADQALSNDLTNFIESVDQAHKGFRSITQFFDRLENIAADVVNRLTDGVYDELRQTADLIEVTSRALLVFVATSAYDFFENNEPKSHLGFPLRQWAWTDLVHEHRTLDYARTLWANAGTDEQRAYVLGYLTHVGGDVCGHSYVNALSGGPYRNHWRRHGVLENFIDTDILLRRRGIPLSTSDLHQKILFASGNFPPSLAHFLSTTLGTTYGSLNTVARVPNVNDLSFMYDAFHAWLEANTSGGFLNAPAPPAPWRDFPDVIKNAFSDFPTVSLPGLGGGSSPLRWRQFLDDVAALVIWALETIVKLLSIAFEVVKALGALALRILIWAVAYLIYEIYLYLRLSLALGGFVHPDNRHLVFMPDITRCIDPFAAIGPYDHYSNGDQTYQLVHPSRFVAVETPATAPFFQLNRGGSCRTVHNIDDVLFLQGDSKDNVQSLLNICAKYRLLEPPKFVSALELTLFMWDRFENDNEVQRQTLPNWSLDSDRGAGWPSWVSTGSRPWTWDSFEFHC